MQACFGRCMRARGLSCGMQSRCDVVTTQGLGGWRAMAASKVVLRCCLYSRSVHQHLGHGPLSCRQRRLQACFRRCMRARGLSCGMQSRCDVVTTQGLGGWRAMAASKVVLRCCLYALLSVGADIWFSPRAESGDELRPFGHNHKVVSANAHLCPPGKSS